jgi:hypothetical protein
LLRRFAPRNDEGGIFRQPRRATSAAFFASFAGTTKSAPRRAVSNLVADSVPGLRYRVIQ